ncbi:Tetratricopeptide-like helical [Penicillium atrosanguineum]|nr:Tetratricopeptide-like helical [Penicillium atrosanguineum]
MQDESSRRRARPEPYPEEWTDEVTHTATPDAADTEIAEENVASVLDEEADGLLRRALGRVRPGRQRRSAMPATPDTEMNDTPARSRRHHRSQSRQ